MNKGFFIPRNYEPILNFDQTEKAIKLIKDFFQLNLSSEFRLRRVTAPIFVEKGTGINDDLNGVERPVSFPIKEMNETTAEIVQSLAKWKRMMLADYNIPTGYGIYADMNAIRPDEQLDNTHSLYVDQWDWEKSIPKEKRNLDYLKTVVRSIYEILKRTEFIVYEHYPQIEPTLPEDITFIHSEELLHEYPDLSPSEREDEITKKYGAVFVIGLGGKLSDGNKHDGRAPDYDDWVTENKDGYYGLNGDILLWNPVTETAFEISSMGIRVDSEALKNQLELTGTTDRKNFLFHKRLLNDELPYSVGGGIGQSRLCMYYLRKAHLGEIQASIWPQDMVEKCRENKIFLL